MALKKTRFRKGTILVPDADALEGIEGELKVSSSDLKMKATLGGLPRNIVTEDQTQTLTNKIIDADLSTITNIDDADIKVGAAINAEKIADGSVDNAEFQYLNGVTSPIQDQLDDSSLEINHIASTGVSSGGVLSINVDPTKFNLTAGTGAIVDYDTDPSNPTLTHVTWGSSTAVSVSGLAIQDQTYILVNSGGSIFQQSNYPTPAQRRANIFIGRLGHSNHTSVLFANSFPDITQSVGSQLYDFMDAMGSFNVSGNLLNDNGANLQLQKSAGTVFFRSFNYPTDDQQPHTISVPSATPVSFFYRTSTALVAGGPVTNFDVLNYDVGGVVTPIPGPVTNAVVHRVFLAPNGIVQIQYGSNVYSNLPTALASIATDNFTINPTLQDVTVLIGYVVAQSNALALNDPNTVTIVQAGRFSTGASGGVNTVISLQQTYNSSNQPEIILDATHGAIDIRDNSTPVIGSLLTIKDNAGVTTYLDVTASNTTIPNPILTDGSATGISILTPEQLDVKQDTFANLTAYALISTNGQLCFATDEKKMYQVVDGELVSVGGAGVIKLTAGENLVLNDLVYISTGTGNDSGRTAGRLYKVDATNDDRIEVAGFVSRPGLAGTLVEVQTSGTMEDHVGLTAGKVYFASATPGAISLTAPTTTGHWAITVALASSATEIIVNPVASASAVFITDTEITFTIANNQPSELDVTGLLIDPLSYRSALIDYSIYRQTDTALTGVAQAGQIRMVYNSQSATWLMSDDFSGENAGVTFSVLSSGQIRYTSNEILGANYVGTLKYFISKTFGV